MDAHQNFLFNCKQSQDQSMMEEYLVNLMLWADTIKYQHGGSSVDNFKLADAISPNGELRS